MHKMGKRVHSISLSIDSIENLNKIMVEKSKLGEG